MYQPNTDVLYHGTIKNATKELAKITYGVAESHGIPYVTATAFYHHEKNNEGYAYAKVGNGEFTETQMYNPFDDEKDEEDATDGQA